MRADELVAELCKIPGVKLAFDGPRFHEAVLQLSKPIAPVLEALTQHGIVGGYDLSSDYPELGNALLVCVTETKNDSDLSRYAQSLHNSLSQMQRAAAA